MSARTEVAPILGGSFGGDADEAQEVVRAGLAADQPQAVAEVEDIDPADWLADGTDVLRTGYVTVMGGTRRLKVAAVSEDEVQTLLKAARRPVPGKAGMAPKTDLQLFKTMFIAYSINKAAGKQAGPAASVEEGGVLFMHLPRKLAGELTEIYKAISEVSGFRSDGDDVERARDFFA